MEPLVTPDGRYIVVRGRLWRRSDPGLKPETRQGFVDALMSARRAVRDALHADDPEALKAARHAVNDAKTLLGERGPVWWKDGTPDLTRHLARTTDYADWWSGVDPG